MVIWFPLRNWHFLTFLSTPGEEWLAVCEWNPSEWRFYYRSAEIHFSLNSKIPSLCSFTFSMTYQILNSLKYCSWNCSMYLRTMFMFLETTETTATTPMFGQYMNTKILDCVSFSVMSKLTPFLMCFIQWMNRGPLPMENIIGRFVTCCYRPSDHRRWWWWVFFSQFEENVVFAAADWLSDVHNVLLDKSILLSDVLRICNLFSVLKCQSFKVHVLILVCETKIVLIVMFICSVINTMW